MATNLTPKTTKAQAPDTKKTINSQTAEHPKPINTQTPEQKTTDTQTPETNKTIIREAFNRWTNATGSFFDLLTDDVRWEITGSTSLSRIYTGKQSFLAEVIIPLNLRLAQKIKPTVRYLFAEDDWVIALWDGEAIATDGQPYNMSYAWFMQMKDKRIFNVVAFLDGIRFNGIHERIPVQ